MSRRSSLQRLCTVSVVGAVKTGGVTLYDIRVERRGVPWSILKRYSHFEQLHTQIVERAGLLRLPRRELPKLPAKRSLKSKAAIIKERIRGFDVYLKTLLKSALAHSGELAQFLDYAAHRAPALPATGTSERVKPPSATEQSVSRSHATPGAEFATRAMGAGTFLDDDDDDDEDEDSTPLTASRRGSQLEAQAAHEQHVLAMSERGAFTKQTGGGQEGDSEATEPPAAVPAAQSVALHPGHSVKSVEAPTVINTESVEAPTAINMVNAAVEAPSQPSPNYRVDPSQRNTGSQLQPKDLEALQSDAIEPDAAPCTVIFAQSMASGCSAHLLDKDEVKVADVPADAVAMPVVDCPTDDTHADGASHSTAKMPATTLPNASKSSACEEGLVEAATVANSRVVAQLTGCSPAAQPHSAEGNDLPANEVGKAATELPANEVGKAATELSNAPVSSRSFRPHTGFKSVARWTGYVEKKGAGRRKLFGRRNWRKRFLVLDMGNMSYFVSRKEFLEGSLPLKNHVVKVRHYRVHLPRVSAKELASEELDRRLDLRPDRGESDRVFHFRAVTAAGTEGRESLLKALYEHGVKRERRDSVSSLFDDE